MPTIVASSELAALVLVATAALPVLGQEGDFESATGIFNRAGSFSTIAGFLQEMVGGILAAMALLIVDPTRAFASSLADGIDTTVTKGIDFLTSPLSEGAAVIEAGREGTASVLRNPALFQFVLGVAIAFGTVIAVAWLVDRVFGIEIPLLSGLLELVPILGRVTGEEETEEEG